MSYLSGICIDLVFRRRSPERIQFHAGLFNSNQGWKMIHRYFEPAGVINLRDQAGIGDSDLAVNTIRAFPVPVVQQFFQCRKAVCYPVVNPDVLSPHRPA